MKKYLFFTGMIMIFNVVNAQRFLKESFEQLDTIKNIYYGESTNISDQRERLFMDFYRPHNDVLTDLPLVIFVHGGGFTGGDKASGYPMTFTEGLVKRGYAVASINYRLGLPEEALRNDTIYFEAMYRAAQDTKTALDYIVKNANLFSINPNKIILMGGSAGAHTILHVAYLDKNELPAFLDVRKMGAWEKNATNILAAINCWGAIVDNTWIKPGDTPLFSMHGVDDKSVPIDTSDFTHGFKYGSRYLYHQMQKQGIYSGMKIYENTGHTLDNDLNKQKEALNEACIWLYKLIKTD